MIKNCDPSKKIHDEYLERLKVKDCKQTNIDRNKVVINTPLSDRELEVLVINGDTYDLTGCKKLVFEFSANSRPKLKMEYYDNNIIDIETIDVDKGYLYTEKRTGF